MVLTSDQTIATVGVLSRMFRVGPAFERSLLTQTPAGEHELIVSLRDDDELVLEQTVSVTAEPS
jgi:hypothetical protein